MSITTMPLLNKLILIGFGLLVLVFGPELISIFAPIPLWISNVFYLAALALLVYGIYLAVRGSRDAPTN